MYTHPNLIFMSAHEDCFVGKRRVTNISSEISEGQYVSNISRCVNIFIELEIKIHNDANN